MSEPNNSEIQLKQIQTNENQPKDAALKEIQAVQNTNLVTPQFVKKKWTLIKFKRMIKRGGFVSARLAAKTLGVDKRTIDHWLRMSSIQEALASDINEFTKNIRKSKDWKASAYLLDKVTGDDKKEGDVNDLKQLIVINT